MIEQTHIENITARLAAVGYTYDASKDGVILSLLWEEVILEICHACNISKVDTCDYAEIERVVTFRLLQTKLKTGTLEGVAIQEIVKKVTEGDTTVEFATGNTSATETLSAYFVQNSEISKNLIASHRKLVW
jgi:hypothetical protein